MEQQQKKKTEIIRENYCLPCKRQFINKKSLRNHVVLVHEKKNVNWKLKEDHEVSASKNQITKNLDRLSCGFCDKQFAQKRNLVRHIQTVHEEKNTHLCSICDKTFETADAVRQHLEEIHEIQNPFKCPKCEKTFKCESGLKQHVEKIIGSNKSCHCSECDYKGTTTCDLGSFQLEIVSISRVINLMTCSVLSLVETKYTLHSDWRGNLVKDFSYEK